MLVVGLSETYQVRRLTEGDIDAIYALSVGNPMFFQYCPPFVTKASILEDMKALPPKMTYDDKYYVGFFQNGDLIAILDLILNYPNADTAFIGLFMVDRAIQGKGIGSQIMGSLSGYLRALGYSRIRLAFAKGNPQSEAFWKKNGFSATGMESKEKTFTAVILEKIL